ncbi:uncharacterized protein LOC117566366 [Drosophila albomicans]|uniref:Uncharacterized protein LOC117566366 n=1 Tax=Drosophila albomicans TaxID=7291 RepID=A0A6P8WTR6_DROAB|nr:uncharacterized protein LOC117566366 [Drosophila albomicans]
MSRKSIREVQQSFAESLGFGNETIWDLLSNEQSKILKKKIRILIPDPEKNDKQCAVFARIRQTIFDAVWEQRKYTNRQSLTSIFYVLVATDETNEDDAINSKKWSCHPVFRARRCVSDINGRSVDCCLIYVDENGRVYQNWESYVTSNQLPEGIMVTPPRGVYNLTLRGDVILQSMPTPASSTESKVLGALDITLAVGGLGAAAVPIAGLAFTVAAPVMLVAGAVGLAAAGYSTARAGAQLVDRSQHEQSINVTDRTARGQWLSVVAGAVGLGAAGATSAVTVATDAGREVGAIAQLTVNSMNISSIMISATGLTSGVIDLILKHQDGDDISTMDALQLSASLFLFTHSVYNFKLASTIINDTANNRIGSYRESLSNQQRRTIDKVVKETIRTKGVSTDIIRNVNEMPSRQQFNRDFNRNGIRPSFAANGQGVELNDQVFTNTAELRIQDNIEPDILRQVTNPMPESFEGSAASGNNICLVGNNGGRVFTGSSGMTELTANYAPENTRNYADGVRILRLSSLVINNVAIELSQFGDDIFTRIINAESFENALLMLADNLNDNVMQFVLNLTETFMHIFWDELNDFLKFYIPAESVLYRIGTHILDNYRYLTIDHLQLFTREILVAVSDYFTSLNPNNFPGLLTKCKVCNHFYNICDL